VINGYSGWPSPLAAKLAGIDDWKLGTLQQAVQDEASGAVTAWKSKPLSHLTYCLVERSADGTAFIYKQN
jgi:hypothetical protein